MNKAILFLLITSLFFGCSNQKEYSFENNVLTIENEGKRYEINALSPDIIKVSYSDSLTKYLQVIAPVLKTPFPVLFQSEENTVILSTENVAVHITIDPFSITYLDRMDGEKTSHGSFYRKSDSLVYSFELSETEKIYTKVAHNLSSNRIVNRFLNDQRLHDEQGADTLNFPISYIRSSKNYMLIFDDTSPNRLDIGFADSNELQFVSKDANPTFYFINGDNKEELLRYYVDLTGKNLDWTPN